MFESLKVPSVQGRRALLIINCQKDAVSVSGAKMVSNPWDFADRIRKIVPYYRKAGTDIVWITTDIKTSAASKSGDGQGDVSSYDLSSYLSSSKVKSGSKAALRNGQANNFGQMVTHEGTTPDVVKVGSGDEIVDELAGSVDRERDLVLSKKFFSAFDETPLLMGLRMKMVTSIHLCGILSHVSILNTAIEAAQHGFDVSVLEDCLGYRTEKEHIDAMRTMADSLGVSGVDSSEIIEESGGVPPPDADPSLFLGPGIAGINISGSDDTDAEPAKSKAAANAAASTSRSRRKGAVEPHTGAIGEGDSEVRLDALSADLAADAFERLKSEVSLQVMKHRTGDVPRRVAVQGEIGSDGSVPVYRHPADESPPLLAFTKTVREIRDECTRLLKQPYNHVLIQLYRDGQDNISEHSDKTLDIARGSNIVNVSLGAQRTMTLRLKRDKAPKTQTEDAADKSPKGATPGPPRVSQRVPLPHNSVFVLGPKSNARWLHAIRADKRLERERSDAEKAYGGERISLTFRHIDTFTNADRTLIWGQGAKSKTKDTAGKILATDTEEAEKMLIAFGHENQSSDFDWDAEYGGGFDALDLVVNRVEESSSA